MFTSVVTPTPITLPQRIIPTQPVVQSIPYTPPCSQYAPSSGSIVIASPTDIYANCTANSLAGPQYPPYDVHCTTGGAGGALQCYELQNGVPTGYTANSIDGICCRAAPTVPTTPTVPTVIYLPQPGPPWPPGPWPPGPPGPPGPSCCRAGGVNACALCLERQAGRPTVVPSSEHFGYMQRCRQMCPNL